MAKGVLAVREFVERYHQNEGEEFLDSIMTGGMKLGRVITPLESEKQ